MKEIKIYVVNVESKDDSGSVVAFHNFEDAQDEVDRLNGYVESEENGEFSDDTIFYISCVVLNPQQ